MRLVQVVRDGVRGMVGVSKVVCWKSSLVAYEGTMAGEGTMA